MSKNMYGIVNGNVLELTTMPSFIKDFTVNKDETRVVVEQIKSRKHVKVSIIIDARGKEPLSNIERLNIMKEILKRDTITNIPKLNSQYSLYLDSNIHDENGRKKLCSVLNGDCMVYDAVSLMEVNEEDRLEYVHNLVFKGEFKITIPVETGFGITSFVKGKESILEINDISIMGDTADEENAERYKYYHKRDVVKKYRDFPANVQPSGELRINDMRYLDPYYRIPLNGQRYGDFPIQRTVSARTYELKEKIDKENSLNANIDESHVRIISTADLNIDIDLDQVPKTGISTIDVDITIIMDNGIEVGSKESIDSILTENYDILYPPVVPDKSEKDDDIQIKPSPKPEEDGSDNKSEVKPTPSTGEDDTNTDGSEIKPSPKPGEDGSDSESEVKPTPPSENDGEKTEQPEINPSPKQEEGETDSEDSGEEKEKESEINPSPSVSSDDENTENDENSTANDSSDTVKDEIIEDDDAQIVENE